MGYLLQEDLQRPLPQMIRVRQQFDTTRLDNPKEELCRQLTRPEIRETVKPGARVAVAVGSRGICNLFIIVKTLVDELRAMGADPFIVSAMGSHGSGTEEGQREVLAEYGITADALGVPVVTTVDTVMLGKRKGDKPVWFDRAAFEADLIVPVNRIKLHTDFIGPLQSGLCKMLCIGLGNHKGCSALHEEPPASFPALLEEITSLILQKAPVGFGIALLENAYDRTSLIEAIPADRLIEREKELLITARGNMPRILLPEADVIVCREIGKDVSGAGFDPNVLGRSSLRNEYELPIPQYQRLVLTDITDASHGNGIGIGLFDVITQKAADKLDKEQTYANAIACNALLDAFVPVTVPDEDTALRVALKCCRGIDRDNPKIIRIQNTLRLETIEVSPALLPAVKANPGLTVLD